MSIIGYLQKQDQELQNKNYRNTELKGSIYSMKSKMLNCYDYTQLEVADELGRWRYPDSEIQEELEALARDHSGEEEMEEVKEGDSVRCICTESSLENWKGRTVLLYPGRKLPGAEKAEAAVIGKKVGEEFNCCMKSTEFTLKVDKVVRKHVMKVCDELTAILNLPGVQTVEDYYRWYHEQHDREYKDKACIVISQYWLEEMSKRSEFQIDEEEKKSWCLHHAKGMYDAYMESGIDVRKQPDGTMITQEEAIEGIAQTQERYFIPYLMYCYFCEKDNFVLTEEGLVEEVEKMAKERGEKTEDLMKQADIETFRMVKYQEHTFHMLMADAEKYLEV